MEDGVREDVRVGDAPVAASSRRMCGREGVFAGDDVFCADLLGVAGRVWVGVWVPTLDRVGVRDMAAVLVWLRVAFGDRVAERVAFGDRVGDEGRQAPQEDWVNPGWQVPKMKGVHEAYPDGHSTTGASLTDGDALEEGDAVLLGDAPNEIEADGVTVDVKVGKAVADGTISSQQAEAPLEQGKSFSCVPATPQFSVPPALFGSGPPQYPSPLV